MRSHGWSLPVVVFRTADVVRRDEVPGWVGLMAPGIAVHIVARATHCVDQSGCGHKLIAASNQCLQYCYQVASATWICLSV
jgi:hypothetical protein